MAQVILDAGPLCAIIDRREEHHSWAVEQITRLPSPFITCDACLTEAFYLLGEYPFAVEQIGELLRRGKILSNFDCHARVERIFQLMRTYRDVPMAFADACLVCMVEDNPGSAVFTIDRDFTIYRQHRRRLIPLIAPF